MRGRLLWAVGGPGALVAAWLALAGGLHALHAGEILPGTRVAGVDVGGLTPAAARARLAPALGDRTVILTYEQRRFTLRPQEVGLEVDVRGTVARAMDAGRWGPLNGLLWRDIASLWNTREVQPVTALDRDRLESAVAAIAKKIERPIFYGDLSIDPSSLRVQVEPPRPARDVDRRAAVAATLAALRRGDSGPVRIPVRTEGVAPRQVRAVADAARAYLKDPLRLTGGSGSDASVEIAPAQLAPVLTVKPVANSAAGPDTNSAAGPASKGEALDVRLGARAKELSRLVDTLAAELDRTMVQTEISAPARPVTIDDKLDLTWSPRSAEVAVTPGKPGRVLRQPATAKAITSAVRDGRHTGKLPIRTETPEIPASAARDVDSLLGTFTTYFECCKPRVTNIQRMAEAVDGTVIMPGEEFSLNGVAGERTRAKGYVPAPYIFRGKLVPDVGGGVSQFSTTTYNAAFFAGLPITDHQPHSYYISRYPPGREATLNYPNIDLTWVNDTDAPILVRSVATDTSVTVSLYGESTGRTVQGITGPRQPWDEGDFKITITREITYPDGRVERGADTVYYDKPPEH